MRLKIQTARFKKPLVIFTGIVLAVFLVLQVVFDAYVYLGFIRPGDTMPITSLIINAVEGRSLPAPIDPPTGKVYLTEGKLVLPPPDRSMKILISSPAGSDGSTVLNITTTNILQEAEAKLWSAQSVSSGGRYANALSDVFASVPNLQACARGVQLFFQKPNIDSPAFQLRATKVLADGRTLYFYTETTCQTDQTPLVNYLKQAQSY